MKKYELLNKAVWITEKGILVLGDLHIGYEESLGVAIPRHQYEKTLGDLKKIIEKIGGSSKLNLTSGQLRSKAGEGLSKKIIREIVILGDLKHEHGKILQQEWQEVSNILDYLAGYGKIILIKGNHDKILEPIAERKGIEIKDFYVSGEFGFMHGDRNFPREISEKNCRTIFLGHLHPAISIVEDVKKEYYKCFLIGKYKKWEIVILPSFFPLVEGSDVIKEDNNLALDLKLENFSVFIPTENEVLDFGKVKNVGKLV